MAKNNLPHKITQYLLTHYSDPSEYTLLNSFISQMNIGDSEKTKAKKLRSILELFESKGYLKWQVSKMSPGVKAYLPHEMYKTHFATFNQKKDEEETLLNNHVSAKLTTDGLDYAIEVDRKRIQHTTSTKITPSIAGFALLLSLVNFIFGTYNKSRTESSIEAIQKRHQILDSILNAQNNRLHFLIDSRKADSLKNAVKITE